MGQIKRFSGKDTIAVLIVQDTIYRIMIYNAARFAAKHSSDSRAVLANDALNKIVAFPRNKIIAAIAEMSDALKRRQLLDALQEKEVNVLNAVWAVGTSHDGSEYTPEFTTSGIISHQDAIGLVWRLAQTEAMKVVHLPAFIDYVSGNNKNLSPIDFDAREVARILSEAGQTRYCELMGIDRAEPSHVWSVLQWVLEESGTPSMLRAPLK